MENKIIIDLLISQVIMNQFKGYDPYDIKGKKFYLNMLKDKQGSFYKKLVFEVIEKFPYLSRKIFKVEVSNNAKAMGLLLTSFVKLYIITKDDKYYKSALKVAKWLEQNYSKGYSGMCWGYPFDWQSLIFIPKETPSSVVSYHVGEGFYELYKLTKNKKYLDICVSICQFYSNDLNIKEFNNETICFSYTPLDNFEVNNANLFVAAFLIIIGHEINNSVYIDYGLRAARFTKNEQNYNGSIFYWSKRSRIKRFMDHYHTGFEIRMLYIISQYFDEFEESWKRYYNFYREHFFERNAVKIKPNNLYPINIHGCSEAILCNSSINEVFDEKFVKDIINWVNKKMLYKKCKYRYMIKKYNKFEYNINISYIRWGTAWMLRALTEFEYRLYQRRENK